MFNHPDSQFPVRKDSTNADSFKTQFVNCRFAVIHYWFAIKDLTDADSFLLRFVRLSDCWFLAYIRMSNY